MTANTRRTFVLTTLIALLASFLAAPAPALAQDAEMKALQKRFKARDPEVRKLKSAGVVGETDDGFLDFVDKRDSAAAKTVDEENADRRELYALIARKEGTKPEAVAIVNAKRNFDRAKPGEYLRTKGNWAKKT